MDRRVSVCSESKLCGRTITSVRVLPIVDAISVACFEIYKVLIEFFGIFLY